MISRYRQDIEQAAASIGWDPRLLEAQVFVESGDDPYAFRYEPAFYRQYLKGKDAWARWGPIGACSFGLLQVIYATACDHQFDGPPESLFQVDVNLRIACRVLAHYNTQVQAADPAGTLAAYNGGLVGNVLRPYRTAAYAQKVFSQQEHLDA